MQYANMVIEASNADLVRTPDNRRSGKFLVRALNSPAGDMRPEEAVAIAYDDIALQSALQNLELRNFDRLALVAFGRELAGWLLPPAQAGATTSVRSLFLKSLLQVGQDTGLRLRLRLPPQLAALPWEYMYVDPPGGGDGIDGFLALNRRISIVRYEPLDAPALSPTTPGNVAVVVALSSPAGFPPLDLAKEKTDLQLALDKQSALIKVVYLDHAKSSDVQSAIARAGAGVFHFAGHGAFTEQMGSTPGTYTGTGSLILDDIALTAEQISVILGNDIRLAVLAACETGRRDGINIWSGTALGLVKAQVPAVVANQFTILDSCAIAFDEQFYEAALVGGLSLEEAVSAGRIAAYTVEPDGREWGVAVLYLRTDDSHLFGGTTDNRMRQQAQDNATTVINSAPTWDNLLKNSVKSARNFQGTPDRPGTFLPTVYVHRTDAENTLNDFLSSEASALIIVGDSGIGKTNTLCSWVMALQEAGHVAFLYNCVIFTALDIEAEIARDLSPGLPDDLPGAIVRIDTLAIAQGKRCVLVFDAISEYRGGDDTGPEPLFKKIIAFVERLPSNIRVVISCRTSTWNRLGLYDISQSFSSDKYYTPAKDQGYLFLQPFTLQLLEQAYQLYAQVFQLKTPLAQLSILLRERLQNPLMLRILAEAYRDEAIAYEYLALGVFKRFYEGRVDVNKPQGLQDQLFLDKLAAEMLDRQQSALLVTELAQHKDLGPTIVSTAPDSSYNRLLDTGILTVVTNPRLPGALGNKLRFAYDQLGGYILALYLLRQPEIQVNQQIQELISHVRQFPLAWYASQALLILDDDAGLYSTLAQIDNIELRELVVESLVDLYTDEAEKAKGIIQQLVQSANPEVQRVGFKAAYSINPPANEIFLWAAIQQRPGLPQLTRNILYLIWQTNPDFTYNFLCQLIAGIVLNPAVLISANAQQTLRSTVEFAFDLLITIYINHCEQQYVIDQTSDIFYELTKNKLHLDILDPAMLGPLGPGVEQFFVQRVTPVFTKPFLDALLSVDKDYARRFFDVPLEERATLKQIAPYLDPDTDLAQVRDVLVTLLKSDLMIFNLAAAVVLSVHAYSNFATMQTFMQSLFEEQGTRGQGRLWILLSFILFLPDTPEEWVAVAEEFTRRLIEEQPAIFYGEEASIISKSDIALLPLGLAYGKQGNSMPYIETLLSDGLKQNNMRLVIRCVKALGTVGFYYPDAALHTLGVTMPDIATASDELKDALVNSLATMRVLHFDDVDDFLRHIGADVTLQRNVYALTDVALVDHDIQLLGLYNNGVHYSVFYPIMRQRLGITALNILADSATPDDFINRYTLEGIHLTRDTDFKLKDWTLPA